MALLQCGEGWAVQTDVQGHAGYGELTTSKHHSSAIWMHSMCELVPPTLQSAFMRDHFKYQADNSL